MSMESYCSFCGKPNSEVGPMIVNGRKTAYLCMECLKDCNDVAQEFELDEEKTTDYLPKPMDIKESLDEYVIGQEKAKTVLAVSVYNHYQRINYEGSKDVEIDKSNVLLIGPTGVGKTLLAQTLARIINVPFTIANTTSYTEAGYVGEDVESILTSLLVKAEYDVELAQKGIVYLDEVDKIRKQQSATKDVSGEGVQHALLKLIEGTVLNVPAKQGDKKNPQNQFTEFDTKNVLFICGGAFHGLEDVLQTMENKESRIGFGTQTGSSRKKEKRYFVEPRPEHLIKYGIAPEFVGRLPVIATLEDLNQNDLVRILREPKNALVKQFQERFAMDGVDLRFTDKALYAIAQKAQELQTGARGLRGIVETALMQSMYEVPSISEIVGCTVTKDCITNGRKPVYKKEKITVQESKGYEHG